MDREILFRGKRADNGEWVEGYFVEQNSPEYHAYIIRSFTADIYDRYIDIMEYNIVEVTPSTVGQYTGLTDRNGVKIFEGDIVHYQYEPGEGYWNSNQNSVIKWESTGFYMEGIMGTNKKYTLSCGWLNSIPHNNGGLFEVIGNIHDNPELIAT